MGSKCHHTCPYEKGAETDHSQKRRRQGDPGGGDGVMWPPEAGRERDRLSCRTLGEGAACQHLDSGQVKLFLNFWSPEL